MRKATGMPWVLPEVEVKGVLMSACASYDGWMDGKRERERERLE